MYPLFRIIKKFRTKEKVAFVSRCLLRKFLHAIQSTAGLEPSDLKVVETVVQCNFICRSISVFDFGLQWFARSE